MTRTTMATAAQITANQANALLSAGPQSPEGKARSAANATKDGLTARNPIVPSGQSAEFEAYRLSLLRDTRPEGALEEEYFHRLLTAGWNLRRARTLESEILAGTNPNQSDEDAVRLLRIARYRRELERTFDRALNQLQQLQTQRALYPIDPECECATPLARLETPSCPRPAHDSATTISIDDLAREVDQLRAARHKTSAV
ncbi:MAG: hypothetical protein HY821_16195 [Acidobacteria bacterium]|nr:hypothetical protein [Acidobacteriota bacterium]